MKANEITSTEQIIEEGWKDTLASAGMVAGIAGLGAANYMHNTNKPVAPAQNKPAITAPAQPVKKSAIDTIKQKKVAKKDAPQKQAAQPVKKDSPEKEAHPRETVLSKYALAAGITGLELAALLAQSAHETMNFDRLSEMGGKSYFNKYDPEYNPKKAKSLGNIHPGDGYRYRGRGYLHITGRYNYRKAGAALGLPLEDNPELVEKPSVAAKVSLWFWKNKVAPRVDDFNDVKAVTAPINPGLRGLKDRQENFDEYKYQLLGDV